MEDQSFTTSILFILFIAIAYLAVGHCEDKEGLFNKGYEAAWEDEERPSSLFTTQEEIDGYEEGVDDAWMYDEGYEDGYEGKKPKYFNDEFYMDGYKDGKSSK